MCLGQGGIEEGTPGQTDRGCSWENWGEVLLWILWDGVKGELGLSEGTDQSRGTGRWGEGVEVEGVALVWLTKAS